MATRQIIILNVANSSDGTSVEVQGVFWLVAPATRTKPVPAFVSAVPLSTAVAWGITPAELLALQAGTLVEQPFDTGQMPKQGLTVPSVETTLQTAYTAAQAALTGAAPASKFIGAFWDGTTWTAAP